MIAIQKAKGGFDQRWISYCLSKEISYKIVDCYRSDIIEQLDKCRVLMWQYYQDSPTDRVMARQLLFALEHAGVSVFPDFKTGWHFDDKIGQKYLFELLDIPSVPTYVFYDKRTAIQWLNTAMFPIVFKLRSGAGSKNVRLIKTRGDAVKIVNKAFGRGFPSYDPVSNLKERWRMFRLGRTSVSDILVGFLRFIIPPLYSRRKGREAGYVYFQDFIPGNNCDIRVIVIDNKAFAIKRLVRENDFRASGSGSILYEKEHFDNKTIQLAFETADKMKAQCIAFDFVYNSGQPLILESSFGFSPEGYDGCSGYWDRKLNWYPGKFDPYGWMIELMLKSQSEFKKSNC